MFPEFIAGSELTPVNSAFPLTLALSTLESRLKTIVGGPPPYLLFFAN